jgi:hypothetical protein
VCGCMQVTAGMFVYPTVVASFLRFQSLTTNVIRGCMYRNTCNQILEQICTEAWYHARRKLPAQVIPNIASVQGGYICHMIQEVCA